MKNLYAKLLEAQKKIHAIKKVDENPYYKSSYFDINTLLSVIKPVLNDLGVLVLQPLGITYDSKPTLFTRFVDVESGEEVEYQTPVIENTDAQKFGATITYLRRFALVSALCLEASDDDDGNSATSKPAHITEPIYEPQPSFTPQGYKDCPNKCGKKMKADSKFPVCYACHMAKKTAPITPTTTADPMVDIRDIPF